MNYGPPDGLRKCLVDGGLFTMPSANEAWPAYVSALPTDPDNILVIYSASSYLQGRIQKNGAVIEHQGIHMHLRATDPKTAYDKLVDLVGEPNNLGFMEKLYLAVVDMDGTNKYIIRSACRRTGILPMGEEVQERRVSYVMNYYLTMYRKLN